MRSIRWILAAALGGALMPAVVAYDDEDYTPPEDEQNAEFTEGYQGSSREDALHRVAEYEVVSPEPILGLEWSTSPYDDTLLSFRFDRLNSYQLSGSASLDLDRTVTVDATLDSLIHRLDHDPLTNLQAVSDIKVVRSTDLEPGIDYQIRHRLYDVRAAFRPHDVPGLTFRLGYAKQQRDGRKQVLGTSHCTSCHTVAQGRDIDRTTTDVTAGLHGRTGKVDLDYQVTTRSFVEHGLTPTAPYEQAFRPATPGSAPDPTVLVLPFNDRLWFQNGDFPVNETPDVKRTIHQFKTRAEIGEDALNLTLVRSTTENQNTNLEYEFRAARARYTMKPTDTVRLNFYARRDELENDSLLVDLAALNGLAGAPLSDGGPGYTGVTYEQWLNNTARPGSDFNFTTFMRASTLNRTEDRLGMDAFWRPSRKNSWRFGYQYRVVDRDNVVLADGTGETTSHTLKVAWNRRAGRRLRWNNSLLYRTTDNPYVNVNGGLRVFSEDPLGQAPSPKSPLSLQYFELHELRVANLGWAPTDEWRLRSNATWARGRWAASANARYRDQDNDELNFSTWTQRSFGIGANLWIAAGPKFQYMVGLDHHRQKTDAAAILPVMDG